MSHDSMPYLPHRGTVAGVPTFTPIVRWLAGILVKEIKRTNDTDNDMGSSTSELDEIR